MDLFWDLLVLPRAYVENLKAGRAHLPAHLPALPCAYMEKFKTRRAAAHPQRTTPGYLPSMSYMEVPVRGTSSIITDTSKQTLVEVYAKYN